MARINKMVAGSLLKGLFKVVDKAVEDKDMAIKIKAELAQDENELIEAEIKAASEIITAEATGGLLQRNWRPLLMLMAMAIIGNNFLFMPYARAFGLDLPVLELPDGLWSLLTLGVGGYVMGRSGEKIATRLAPGRAGGREKL